ncbi:unnamed protein product [Durusdinium trenchii]|uniref:Zinc transporter ZupT n=1 Tax=Durusdinium trenchii TaxID=1381693 RepID=A0ABP0PQT3_9DINO
MVVNLDHAGIAFLMVVVAGLSTCLGASAVFFNCLVQLASRRVLAAGLGFSSGIMLYVSFIEIFQKAKDGFTTAGIEEKHAYMMSTGCLFGGMILMRLVVALTYLLDPEHEQEFEQLEKAAETAPPGSHEDGASLEHVGLENKDAKAQDSMDPIDQKQTKKLLRMGLSTALAITLHNLPEGLAGMVAGLIDPSVGFTLTFAIAIHNIPEGLCVALPIYYSTGSRLKGFLLAALSGISEPIGALVAWAIVAVSGDDMKGIVYGILFGTVAGVCKYLWQGFQAFVGSGTAFAGRLLNYDHACVPGIAAHCPPL